MNKTKNYFELRAPRDMFEKAKREHERLMENFDIDNLFNYFVTTYHIQDYFDENSVIIDKIKVFLKDQDLEDCKDLCHKGKHLALSRGRLDPRTQIMRDSINGTPLNTMTKNAGKSGLCI